jgi:hypothetical protein
MRLCIPKIGSLLQLTEDWTISLDEEHSDDPQIWGASYAFEAHLKETIAKKKIIRQGGGYYGARSPYEVEVATGTIVVPKGSILRLEQIAMWGPRQKRYHMPDSIQVSIIDTSMPFKNDDQVIKTKTGRVSKKKPKRGEICFSVSPKLFNEIEFEFTI